MTHPWLVNAPQFCFTCPPTMPRHYMHVNAAVSSEPVPLQSAYVPPSSSLTSSSNSVNGDVAAANPNPDANATPYPPPAIPTSSLLVAQYLTLTSTYTCRPNPGILSTLMTTTDRLRPTAPFHDRDAIPLSSLLSSAPAPSSLDFVKVLDFTLASKFGYIPGMFKGLRSAGVLALAAGLPSLSNLEVLKLSGNKFGSYPCPYLFNSIKKLPKLNTVKLRGCYIGLKGSEALVDFITTTLPTSPVKEIDVSLNALGHEGITCLATALAVRQSAGGSRMSIDIEANLVFLEALNSVTHGLGVFLSIVGTVLLTTKVANESPKVRACAAIYSASLLLLYLSSTLYHSFFALKNTKAIFSVFDHSAIYILIAGSYTPFLGVTFPDKPMWSEGLLYFLWLCCILGVGVEAFGRGWKWKSPFSLTMYLAMGWSAVACLPDLSARLPPDGVRLLILGGLGYTCGVPFFVRNNNLDHSIWHLFVVAGSLAHWCCVYYFVTPLAGKEW